MALIDVIVELEKAAEGSRALDGAVAQQVGWRRKVENIKNEANGETTRRVLWIVPNGHEDGKVPHFTTSFDDAMLAAVIVAPDDTRAVAFADGEWTAVVGSGPYCQAETGPLALCVAALKFKAQQAS
ncbi:hypothetical protein [Sinorhizobium meliloti]|uniref:hypothetical protein n=1 Tax=Rhizobium meliloti TaxID=382 RepID=UPI000FDC976A|nr:hypothetical protein [Sinorhizobium meliloti]RVN04640.1 hypothetical protein CN112_24960 [Sinorhizobium meliloti]